MIWRITSTATLFEAFTYTLIPKHLKLITSEKKLVQFNLLEKEVNITNIIGKINYGRLEVQEVVWRGLKRIKNI